MQDALLLAKAELAQANFIGALCGSDILDAPVAEDERSSRFAVHAPLM